MASLENQVTSPTGSNAYAADDDNPSSREIRREIERTRGQMDRNLDALEQKLTPSQLAIEAWSLFRGSSTAGAGRLWRIAREHPGPSAVIGVGLAWLMTDSTRRSGKGRLYDGQLYQGYQGGGYGYGGPGIGQGSGKGNGKSHDQGDHEGRIGSALHVAKETLSDAAGSARDAVTGAAGSAKEAMAGAADSARGAVSDVRERVMETAGSMRDRASEQARQARLGFWQGMEERPLAIGAAALALGVVAGLLVPSTRKEDELMGETRDQLLDRARELGGEALDKGKQVASVAVDTLKEEAGRQELTPGNLAEKVRNVARETVGTVKEEGMKQASELKESVTAS